MKSKPILKYVGLTLLVLGALFNILMLVSGAYPTYLFFIVMAIGLFFFLVSFLLKDLNTWWQILISLVPFIVAYILFDISSPSKDIFLIPKGFTGQVNIYYDQPNGHKEEFEKGCRIYRIPANGKLKTVFKLKGHSISLSNAKYFYVDSLNNRQKLNQYCGVCPNKDTIALQVINPTLEKNGNGTYQTFFIEKPMNIK